MSRIRFCKMGLWSQPIEAFSWGVSILGKTMWTDPLCSGLSAPNNLPSKQQQRLRRSHTEVPLTWRSKAELFTPAPPHTHAFQSTPPHTVTIATLPALMATSAISQHTSAILPFSHLADSRLCCCMHTEMMHKLTHSTAVQTTPRPSSAKVTSIDGTSHAWSYAVDGLYMSNIGANLAPLWTFALRYKWACGSFLQWRNSHPLPIGAYLSSLGSG